MRAIQISKVYPGTAALNQVDFNVRYICRNGFEHHTAMNASHTAAKVYEALTTYCSSESEASVSDLLKTTEEARIRRGLKKFRTWQNEI